MFFIALRRLCYNAPMRTRWKTPFRALEIFEAAARLGDANAAARELHITRAAVSQQLHKLEEQIGTQLFEYGSRPARPTKAALKLMPAISSALDLMDAACREVAKQESGRIVVAAPPSTAAIWLIPRMGGFRRESPESRLSVQSDFALADLYADEVDAALRYGTGDYPGLFVEKLADEFIAPLCSPRHIAENPPARPEDLLSRALIDDRMGAGFERHEWRGWLAALGVRDEPQNIVVSTNRSHQALCLAKAGEGVALGRGLLSVDDLRLGLLAPALPFSIPADCAYYFVCPFSARKNPAVCRFHDWLRAEFEPHQRAMRDVFPPPRRMSRRVGKRRT